MRKQKKTELQKIEGNLARMGLISIQDRIPESYVRWSEDFTLGNHIGTITCEAIATHGGVPHGLDNDIMTAILDLYINSGANKDGILITTAYQILTQAGLDTSGRYYQLLMESLKRLRFAAYTVTGLWYDAPQQRYTTTTFTHFSDMSYSSNEKEKLGKNSELMLRVSEHIVNSIQAQFLRHMDLNLLRALSRPLSRSLYRLLEARRMDPVIMNRGEPLMEFETSLQAWASACKIVDRRSDKIRRTLEPAHQELIELGYLLEVKLAGRGMQQVITYSYKVGRPDVAETFSQPQGDPSPLSKGKSTTNQVPSTSSDTTKRLAIHGVSAVMIRKLYSAFSESHISGRLDKAERGIKSGYRPKNRSGFIVDFIRADDDKYTNPLFDPPQIPAALVKEKVAQIESEASKEFEDELTTISAMSRSNQVTWFLGRVRFLLMSVLNPQEITILELSLEKNDMNIVELPKQITEMFMTGKKDQIRLLFNL